jgi:hypothetical protein
MRFMLILKATQETEANVLPEERVLAALSKYSQGLTKSGVLLTAEGIQPSAKGTWVRYANGEYRAVDGPHPSPKDLAAGFWLLQAKSRDEALEWAKRCPLPNGELEVRQVFEVEDFPVDPAEQPGGRREQEVKFRDEAAAAQADAAATPAAVSGTSPRFLSALKADKHTENERMPSEQLLTEMGRLMETAVKADVMIAGEGLRPTKYGARVRFDGGKASVLDGPFTETKELIAGYSIIRARNKAEAAAWAQRCLDIHVRGTGIDYGAIEVRELYAPGTWPLARRSH